MVSKGNLMAKKRAEGTSEPSSSKLKAKASCYWIEPADGTAEDLCELLREFARENVPRDLESKSHKFLVLEPDWHRAGADKMFTASVFRRRSRSHPSMVGKTGVERLVLPEGMDLGEPMCFAYDPLEGVAAVYSAQGGPTQAVIPLFFKTIGFPYKVEIAPVIRQDMMQRMNRIIFFKWLSYKLSNPTRTKALDKLGPAVGGALDVLSGIKGADTVELTVSAVLHKQGLLPGIVKSVARGLYKLVGAEVKELKVYGSEQEGKDCELLNLVDAHFNFPIELSEIKRELDRDDCQKKLVRGFEDNLPQIRKCRHV